MKSLTRPVQVLLDKTEAYHIDASDKKQILVYTDPAKKLKPKLYTRVEFEKVGGIVALYRGEATHGSGRFKTFK
jgi:hypothetical protein